MAFGFPAYHEERVRYDASPDELMDASLAAFTSLGWGRHETGRWDISASTGLSFWSWGESLRVHIGQDSSLYVRSQCAVFTQCIDWGRNSSNVRRFLARVDDALADMDRRDRLRDDDDRRGPPDDRIASPRQT